MLRIDYGANNREVLTLAQALDYRDTEYVVLIGIAAGLLAALLRELGEKGVKSVVSSTIGRYAVVARWRGQGGLQRSQALR